MTLKVAVIGGGDSAEAEISRVSAGQIADALQATHTVRYIELSPTIDADLNDFDPDVVFPVLHGPVGEDGTIQGFLELLGRAYVGSAVRAAVLGMDKRLAKQQFRAENLPVLEEILVRRGDESEAAKKVLDAFGDRIACKPMSQGSALGVTLLPDGGDVQEAIDSALQFDDQVLVEPYVKGREITVGVLDLHNEDAFALPVTEIIVDENEWYDFTNRYTPGRSRHVIPAEIDDELSAEIQQAAVEAHTCLGCRDLSRVDLLLEEDRSFWILEVNTMPGMTPTSLYPDACRAIGLEFEQLAARLVDSAHRRAAC